MRSPPSKTNEISNIIGISIQGEKAAVIGVGDRLNKEPYTETDFNFLKLSCQPGGRLHSERRSCFEERIEKERMEEELSIAKSIQIGLLTRSPARNRGD
jgi:phosphoserine phosphatase RsbU/P